MNVVHVVNKLLFLFSQLSNVETNKRKRRSLKAEAEEKKEKQGEKTLPVLHLQGQKKKSYTLVPIHLLRLFCSYLFKRLWEGLDLIYGLENTCSN